MEQLPGLKLDDTLLFLGRTKVPQASIRSLTLEESTYPRRNSLFGMVEERVITLTVGLDRGGPVVYTLDEDRIPPGIRFDKEDFDGFKDLYGTILNATFPYRIAPYLKELDSHGFFRLGPVSFYPGEKILIKKRVIPADRVVVRHMDRNLWIRNKKPSLFHHFNVRIPLAKDPDVLLALVKRFETGVVGATPLGRGVAE